MAKAIEYRVRAVYPLHRHQARPNRDVTDVVAEVNAQYMANRMAKGLAWSASERDPSEPEPQVFTLDLAAPGRVARALQGRAERPVARPTPPHPIRAERPAAAALRPKPWSYERGGTAKSGIGLSRPTRPTRQTSCSMVKP